MGPAPMLRMVSISVRLGMVLDHFYLIDLAAPATIIIDADWNSGMDLDILVVDEAFTTFECFDGATGAKPEQSVCSLGAGGHLIWINNYDAAAGSYVLEAAVDPAPDVVSFATNILPYFEANCNVCHGAAAIGGIRLDSHTEVSTGSNANGPLIVAGNSDDATAILIPQLHADHNSGPDDNAFIGNFLAKWIDDGAIDN